MENLKKAMSLLNSVYLTMDTISVVHLDNQDKFVGCGEAVKTAEQLISEFIASVEACAEKKEDEDDG